jgi:hypothetical protein
LQVGSVIWKGGKTILVICASPLMLIKIIFEDKNPDILQTQTMHIYVC